MGGAAAPLIIGGSVLGAYGAYQQGTSQNKYYQFLAKQSEKQAVEVKQAAKEEVGVIQDVAASQVSQVGEAVDKTLASQKVGLAASGISLSSGTAEDVARDTFDAGLKDEAAIRYNADISAWQTTKQAKATSRNLRRQAQAYRKSGAAAKSAGTVNAFSTLLGGVGSAYAFSGSRSKKAA